ncbi:MAG: SRPBCC domain-containing protein [Woeseiaceae bacterium]|nr:SRPBCC domain-containing protein [Woeseiaceae bacterium]
MKTAIYLTISFAVACPSLAAGEVLNAAPGGFTVQHERLIAADRAASWNAALSVGDWWSDDHTVSGDAGRMRIDARPLGCFCEYLGSDDGVVHLTVTSVSSEVMLRMTGALGPLGLMGVSGNMTWEFFDDVAGTRVRFTYAVGGYYDKGLDTIAAPVDSVIGDALERLKDYIERD